MFLNPCKLKIFFLLIFSKMAVEMIQKSGKLCVLDVEVNGVKNIKQTDLNAKYIFVKPPSLEDLVSFGFCLCLPFLEGEGLHRILSVAQSFWVYQ